MKIELENGLTLSSDDNEGDDLKTDYVSIKAEGGNIKIDVLIKALEAMKER